jgi:hypothetical protein
MTNLIIPAAGKSSRFSVGRPKWALTLPNGDLIIEQVLKTIDLNQFEAAYVVVRQSQIDSFTSMEKLSGILEKIDEKISLIILNNETKSQSETVYEALKAIKLNGSFFVKDSDNLFKVKWSGNDALCCVDLHEYPNVTASNKSFILRDPLGKLAEIIEKNIVSNEICCGGYGFSSSTAFMQSFEKLSSVPIGDSELFMSLVVQDMVYDGHQFELIRAEGYLDIGTQSDYDKLKKKAITIFCDIDGVICYNGSKFSEYGWRTDIIKENVDSLLRLQKKMELYLIITTSRPRNEVEYLKKLLAEYGLSVGAWLTDLPHSKRVIINDFANSNKFPTADAINLPRDSNSLSDYLRGLYND